MTYFSSDQIASIHNVDHLKESIYCDLDLDKTVDFFARRYVEPISKRIDITDAVMVDGGAGYGWLSLAFLFFGGKRAVLIDPDQNRLAAAREIAKLAGVSDNCEFLCREIQKVGLRDDEVEIFAAVEILEHIGQKNVPQAIKEIARSARSLVLITTPNKLFPVVAHDTRLPFAHWMPNNVRKSYSRLFKRESMDYGNHFLAPWDLRPLSKKYRPDTKIGTYSSLGEFRAFYPHYLPYGRDASKRMRNKPDPLLKCYLYISAAILRNQAYWIVPNMASIWVRREH